MKKQYYLWVLFMIFCSSTFGQNQFLPFTKSNQRSVDALQTIKPNRTLESMRAGYMQVTYSFPGAMLAEKAEKGEMYNFLHIDQFGKLGQVGAPALPMRNDMIAVSRNIHPSVKLVDVEYIDYTGYNVYPALELPMDTQGAPSPKFEKDPSVYEKDAFFPDNVVNIISDQIMKDARMLRVQVCPVQFNPVTKTLRVYSKMVYQIRTGMDKTKVNTSREDLNILKRMVINPENIQQEKRNLQTDSEEDNASKDYIIITHSMFDHAAKKLASWKASLGYKVEIVSKDSWSTEEVKEAIHSRYNTWVPKPSYFVIIGDNEQVPGMDFKTSKGQTYASDLYYSCMDGADDYTPDIARGRISVATAEQSEVTIDKIINYEKNPVADANFYRRGLNCAQFQDVYDGEAPDGYAARRFCHTSEDIRNYVIGQGYNVDRVYYTDAANNPTHFDNGYFSNGEALPDELLRENGFNWDGGADDIAAAINDGRFYLFHRDHGYAGGTGWAHPEFLSDNIGNLRNGNKLPVVFSINCHTGEYQLPECFAEKFLRQKDGGAVAVFGAAYYSLSGPNDGLSLGMVEAIWPNPGITPSFGNGAGIENPGPSGFENSVTSLGDVLNMGLMRMDQTWAPGEANRLYTYRLFHLFGDPAMKMWTQSPAVITADMPEVIECGASSLTVSNISNPDALVTVVQGDKLLAKSNVIAGKAEINFAAVDNIDKLVVTVSAPNHRPVFKEYVVKGCSSSPEANFSISKSMIVLGENNQAIKFTDLTTYSPTSWLWDFGTADIEFEDETSATSQNPVVKFLTKGVYDIKLTATNENGNSEYTEEKAVKVYASTLEAACFGQTTNMSNNYGMGIYAFSLNTINSSSASAVKDGGYKDFSDTHFTSLVAGKTYKSKVTVGGTNPESVKIFLDKNNDGVFGDGEEIASIENFTGEKEFDFPVPYLSELNNMLRLRVISDYKGNTISDACYASTYGQTEDYAILVKAGLASVETLEIVERGFDFAKLKAKLISDGRGTVAEKGIVLAKHTLPTIADTKLVDLDESAEEYTLRADGLDESSSYSYRAYVVNEFGISYGEEKSFVTYSGEPDAHVTKFATGLSLSTWQAMSWTDAASTIKPWGYMIKWAKDDAANIIAPVDGVVEEANCIYIGAAKEFAVAEGLDYDSHYFYKIYPYTNEGSSINYYTGGDVPVIDTNTLPFGEYLAYNITSGEKSITAFQLNTINNSDERPNAGYNDFTDTSTDLKPNQSYKASVSFDPGGNYGYYLVAWVDWNHDGWFDSETEVIDFGTQKGAGSASKDFTVPADVTMGRTTLRLTYVYGKTMPKSFGNAKWCSIEDYSINVDASAAVPGLWTGENSTSWEDVANWSEGKLPSETTDVLLQAGSTNYPVLASVTHVRSIDVAKGASITIGEGADLNIDENINIAGTFVSNAGIIDISGAFNSVAGSQVDINGGHITMNYWGRDASSTWAKGTINLTAGIINAGTVKFSNSNVVGQMAEEFILNVTGDLGFNYNGWADRIMGNINVLAGKSEHFILASASNANMQFKKMSINTPGETVYLISDDQENAKSFTVTDKFNIVAGTVMCKNKTKALSALNINELAIADGASFDISSTSSLIKDNVTGKGTLIQTSGSLVLNANGDQILNVNGNLFDLSCEGNANVLVKNDISIANKLNLVSGNIVVDACNLFIAKDCALLAAGTNHIETINNAKVEKEFAGSVADQKFGLPIGYGAAKLLVVTNLKDTPSEDGSLFFSYENNKAEGVSAEATLNANWKINGDDIMKTIPVDIVCSVNGFDLSAEAYFWANKTNVWNTISAAEPTKPFAFSLDSPVTTVTAMTKGDAPTVTVSDPSGEPATVAGVDESMEYLYNSTDWKDCYADMTIYLNGNNTFIVRKKATNSAIESLSTENLDANPNTAPIADAGAAQTVNEGDLVNLNGKASTDADKQDLTFAWTSKEGVVLTGADTSTPSFTAPSVVADKDYTFELTVSDGDLISTSSVVITVKNVNIAPIADAGAEQTVNEGDLVTLDASASSDSDNQDLTFAWICEEGVPLTNPNTANPSFMAPEVDVLTECHFVVTVSDGDLTSTSSVIVKIKNVNTAPIADAGAAQTVNEGDLVNLNGKASTDADKQDLTFAWTSKEGVVLTDADTSTPSFTAPSVVADKDYTFELTVSDGDLISTSSVVITVKNVNIAPVADAGAEQTVNAGDLVTLDASASSDVDANTTLTYLWTSEDDNIVIENNTLIEASFIAPELVSDTDFEIKLTVSDGIAESVSTVVITVKGIVTGIEDIDDEANIVSIYPNPCRDKFKIHLGERPQEVVNINIYNITGRVVYQGKMYEQDKTIPFSFASGLYFVRIRMGETITVKKIVVK